MFKKELSQKQYILIISSLLLVLFHYPFFKFVFEHLTYASIGGVFLIISLVVAMLIANAFALYLFFSINKTLGKILTTLFFIVNAVAVYFINTYQVIIDESMIGNILNTNYEESSSFFSLKLILYIFCLGILPSIFIFKINYKKDTFRKTLITIGSTLGVLLLLVLANASYWLWIDKNSKSLGGLAMPWSYIVNTSLFYIHQSQKNQKEIPLPDAVIKDQKKAVVVLVIGESARSENFSLYGYSKTTNPLLSKVENLHHLNATSCATYTTAGVKCILEHSQSDKLYEILPNYLFRNNVDVIWKTTNWGEPPVHVPNYQNKDQLSSACKGENCGYDEMLLNNLKDDILSSTKNKILIVLHTSTSHGPTYSKKYPKKFETFSPVCNSVELSQCSKEELINAYDNTIVYTDYLLHEVIENLRQLHEFESSMIYLSDHGESLGEKNLYMHGVPMSLAPKEQYEIPFIVWTSDSSKKIKNLNQVTQNHVFHSVMKFLSIESPIYNETLNIYQ